MSEVSNRLARAADPLGGIETLKLSDRRISRSLSQLEDVIRTSTSLTELDLRGSRVGDEGARAVASGLKHNTVLKILGLASCSISHVGADFLVQALLENSTLEVLNLRGNDLGDLWPVRIAELINFSTSMKRLDLSCNDINEVGATSIAGALANNSTLETLSVFGNSFGGQGAKQMAVALTKNHSLTDLDMSDNDIMWEASGALAQALWANTTLSRIKLANNWMEMDACHDIGALLSHNSTITELDLANNMVEATGACTIAEAMPVLGALQVLDLGCNNICDEGGEAIAAAVGRCSSLKRLILDGNSMGFNSALCLSSALEASGLEELDMSSNLLGHAGAIAILKALVQPNTLKKLSLKDNDITFDSHGELARIVGDSLQHTNCVLEELNLRDNYIGDVCAAQIAVSLSFPHCHIKSLSLLDCGLGPASAWELGEALSRNCCLEELYISANEVGDSGIALLAAGLTRNTVLQTLCLKGSELTETTKGPSRSNAYREISNAGGEALAAAIGANKALTCLSVMHCGMQRQGAQALCIAIRDAPRCGGFSLHNFVLCRVLQGLDLPPDSSDWSNEYIMDVFSLRWREKLLAFAMGHHLRLGGGGGGIVPSSVYDLDDHVMEMIGTAYWGRPGRGPDVDASGSVIEQDPRFRF